MSYSDDTDPPIIEPADEVPAEVLRELSDAFGNTPVDAAPPTVFIADIFIDDTPPALFIDVTVPTATTDMVVPTATTDMVAPVVIESENLEQDVIYLDDAKIDAPPRDTTGAQQRDQTTRIVAGSRLLRILRRLDPRRRTGRRSLVWVSIAVFLLIAVIGAVVLLTSPALSVRNVQVEGSRYVSKETLAKAKDLIEGETILTLDTKSAIAVLEADPCVRNATIHTKLPNTAIIDIEERTPRVWFRSTDLKFRVIDEEGHVLAVLTGQPTEYMEVTGLAPNLAPGDTSPDVFTATAQLWMSIPDELSDKVTRFGVTTAGEITMSLTQGTFVKFGAPVDLRQKLISVVVVMRRPTSSKLVLIDVSSGEVVVK